MMFEVLGCSMQGFWIVFFLMPGVLFGATKITFYEAYHKAAAQSEVVRQGEEQLVQADARIDQLTGGIYPNLAFNVSHLMQPEPSDPVARSFSPQHQTTAGFSLTQPIFKGLREWNGLGALRHQRAAQELMQQVTLTKVFQDVAVSYFQILSLEQDLKNLEVQSDLYRKRVADLTARVQRGESNQTDVISAEATEASLSAEKRLIEGQREAAREAFEFLTGLSRESELVDPNLVTKDSAGTLEQWLNRIEERPDVKAARERAEAARKSVTVAWGTHWPSVDLVGNYYLTRPGFLSDLKWEVTVRLTFPLFEGGATQAKVTEASSKEKEAQIELERLRRIARQEVRSLFERVRARLDHVKRLETSAELTRKNTLLLERDYRRGLARNIDVQLALTENRVAQRAFDQAHFSAQLEWIQLQAASAMVPAAQTK